MSNLKAVVYREDVRGLDILFWHGPTRYNLDSLREWEAEHGSPWHKADFAWHLAIFEEVWPEGYSDCDEAGIFRIHDEYHETWADAMAEANYILANPRSIEGPDRAWELDYMANANKV